MDLPDVLVDVETLSALDLNKKLLSVGPYLGSRARANELLNAFPVFAVDF